VENFFLYTLSASFLAPLLVFAGLYKEFKNNGQAQLLLSYSLFFFVYNTLFYQIEPLTGSKLYYYIYTTVEFSAFALLLYSADDNFYFKKSTATLWPFFITFCTYRYIFEQDKRMDSYDIALESFILLSLIIYYFYLRFKRVDDQYLYQSPYFWFMTGILIYLGFTFFFNILVNHVEREVIRDYYHFSYIGDIVKNLLFAVGLLQLPRRSGTADRTQTFNAPNLDLI